VTTDLLAALCLLLVLEGLVLFAGPATWKRMVQQLGEIPDRVLRGAGASMILVGLLALQWVR
jgi:hypothetical protein